MSHYSYSDRPDVFRPHKSVALHCGDRLRTALEMHSSTGTDAQSNCWMVPCSCEDSGKVFPDGAGDAYLQDLCLHIAYALAIEYRCYKWVALLVALQNFYLFIFAGITDLKGHCEAVELGMGQRESSECVYVVLGGHEPERVR